MLNMLYLIRKVIKRTHYRYCIYIKNSNASIAVEVKSVQRSGTEANPALKTKTGNN